MGKTKKNVEEAAEMRRGELNRRQFLTGLGVVGATAAVTGLAACSSSGAADTGSTSRSETAATDVEIAPQAQRKLTWLPEEPTINDSDVEEELTADVVVIGCGVAGTTAARSATEEGASVIVIEKSADPAVCRSGEYAVIGGEVFGTWGRGDGYIDPEMAVDREMDEMCYFPKRAIYSKWAHGIGSVFDWYCSANPDIYICPDSVTPIPEDKDCVLWPFYYPLPEGWDYTQESHPTYPSSAKFANPDQHVILRSNWDAAESQGATIYTGHFAEKLIKDGDRVSGVYARNSETGMYKKVTATKGVILATGDYAGNDAMLAYYVPEVVANGVPKMWPNMDVEGKPTNQGDGEKMGAWINAAITQHHAPMIHYMGDFSSVGTSPFLRLNKLGKRFMNEDMPGQQVQNQAEVQPGKMFWTIFDSKWAEQVPNFQAMHGGVSYVVDTPTPENLTIDGVNPYITRDAVQNAAATADEVAAGTNKTVRTADTIDELLALTGIEDVEAAKASIERYNELAKAGVDEDFGKKATRMFPIENPPYYVFESGMSMMLVCIGGLESDEDCHVYDNDGHIIPGLYVCGNVQGNRYAVAYPIAFKGISHSLCLFYGYTAGKNVVAGV